MFRSERGPAIIRRAELRAHRNGAADIGSVCMPILLRALLAIVTGVLVTVVLAYLGAIVLIVVAIGLPLGSTGREPTSGEYLGLLLIAGAAAAVGGHIAAGIARSQRKAAVIAAALFLGGGALWGFSKPASQWPTWWAPVLAGAVAAGMYLGGTILAGRHK
jgi:hypothetical protein